MRARRRPWQTRWQSWQACDTALASSSWYILASSDIEGKLPISTSSLLFAFKEYPCSRKLWVRPCEYSAQIEITWAISAFARSCHSFVLGLCMCISLSRRRQCLLHETHIDFRAKWGGQLCNNKTQRTPKLTYFHGACAEAARFCKLQEIHGGNHFPVLLAFATCWRHPTGGSTSRRRRALHLLHASTRHTQRLMRPAAVSSLCPSLSLLFFVAGPNSNYFPTVSRTIEFEYPNGLGKARSRLNPLFIPNSKPNPQP